MSDSPFDSGLTCSCGRALGQCAAGEIALPKWVAELDPRLMEARSRYLDRLRAPA